MLFVVSGLIEVAHLRYSFKHTDKVFAHQAGDYDEMEMLCAATAGVLGRFPCHPLDTVKTVAFTGHYGASPSPTSSATIPGGASRGPSGAWQVARTIYRQEGVRGFYRGVGIAVGGAAPGNVLYLLTYDYAKRFGEQHVDSKNFLGNALLHLAGGFTAEAVSCAVWVPVDVIKERQQSQSSNVEGRYRNSWDALRTIFRNESLSGLYRGYWSTLASFGPFSAVYFMSLETIDQLHPLPPADAAHQSSYFLCSLAHAAAANIISCLVTNPLEMIKTRMQVQRAILTVEGKSVHSHQFSYEYRGVMNGMSRVIREEGVRGLWRGSGARILYACPNSALTMAIYRSLKQHYATNPPPPPT
ncbi:mitochondrial carrier protein, putative [Bodo saltans]|uniref:Mitochondrial carrier protein, putative n=1 Tax=Bodo saltans TaxID=75058 RepID=A0A0S4J045_BODSA|nr:mitochondrial carrier protein, putative [Bodo saltans]|eukprot:CUG36742.1 mitochondrial carrier protein, putative [Bodo saltans]